MNTRVLVTASLCTAFLFPTLPAQDPGGILRMIPVMTALDKNRDGILSAEEIHNAPAALMALDKNNDGKLSADELAPDFGGFGRFGAGQRGGRGRGRQVEGPPIEPEVLLHEHEDPSRAHEIHGGGQLAARRTRHDA